MYIKTQDLYKFNKNNGSTGIYLTGLGKFSRPDLRDQDQDRDQDLRDQDQDQDQSLRDQDQDQDHKKSVLRPLKTETARPRPQVW